MDEPFSAIPWNTPALWQAANTSLSSCLRHNRHRLAESLRLAHGLKEQLTSISRLMDRLCRVTCPHCTAICCLHAWVWADFKDLLFLHLADISPPNRQLLGRRGESCRYGSPQGCRLERLQRPFVCTWYLCPAQTRILCQQPMEQKWLSTTLQQVKKVRRRMEDQFIQSVYRFRG